MQETDKRECIGLSGLREQGKKTGRLRQHIRMVAAVKVRDLPYVVIDIGMREQAVVMMDIPETVFPSAGQRYPVQIVEVFQDIVHPLRNIHSIGRPVGMDEIEVRKRIISGYRDTTEELPVRNIRICNR